MPKIMPISTPAKVITQQTQPKPIVKVNTQAAPDAPILEQPEPKAPVTPELTSQSDSPEELSSEASKLLSPEHTALARKEKAMRDREKDLQAKEAALEQRIKTAVDEALGGYKTRLKLAPLDVLNEEGLTYDQLVEQAVNQPDPETRTFQSKLDKLEQTVSKQQEEAQKRDQAQRDSAINQIRHNVKSLVNSDEAFETIKGTDNYEDVVNKIVTTFDETGLMMSIEDAAKEVEEELFQEAIKIASLNKVKNKLTPQAVQETKPQSTEKQQIKTITNNMSTSKPLSARDRAIARFKGENF